MVNVIKVSKMALMASVLIGSIPYVHAMDDDLKNQLNSALSNPNRKAKAADEYAKALDAYQVPMNTPVKQGGEGKNGVVVTELQTKFQARLKQEEKNPEKTLPRLEKIDTFAEVSVYRKQPATDPKQAKLRMTIDERAEIPVSAIVPNYRPQPQPTGPANLYQKTVEETILPPMILQKK